MTFKACERFEKIGALMDLKDIRELVRLIDKSSVTQLKIEQDGTKISISKQSDVQVVSAPVAQPAIQPVAQPAVAKEAAPAAPAAEQGSSSDNYIEVRSPMVGTFYAASSPDADPFVKAGDTIETGDVLCIVEAMKIMNEIKSEQTGKVAKVLVNNGEPVEFNQVMFLLEK